MNVHFLMEQNVILQKTLGPKELILGRSDMEPGLNEGLRIVETRSRSNLHYSSVSAYGLSGDGKMIPQEL